MGASRDRVAFGEPDPYSIGSGEWWDQTDYSQNTHRVGGGTPAAGLCTHERAARSGWRRAGWLVGAVSLATETVTFTRGDDAADG